MFDLKNNNNNNNKKSSRSEARKWLFNLAKSPTEYENQVFVYRIAEINRVIEELLKLYNKSFVSTKSTYNNDHLRAEILKEIKSAKITLSQLQIGHAEYKRRIKRNEISI